MTDFNLSDKQKHVNTCYSSCNDEDCKICNRCYTEFDVKEFIRLLKENRFIKVWNVWINENSNFYSANYIKLDKLKDRLMNFNNLKIEGETILTR